MQRRTMGKFTLMRRIVIRHGTRGGEGKLCREGGGQEKGKVEQAAS